MALGGIGSGAGVGTLGSLRNLYALDDEAARHVSRISSGESIGGWANADRAALIGIAQQLAVQVQGLNAAAGNVQYGIGAAQIADGGLSTTEELLGRARELAVQAANDTLDPNDRQAIQDEFQQIQQQIDQTANSTQFNGQTLLNGTTPSATVLAGANSGEDVTLMLPDATTAALGISGASVDTQANANDAIGQIDAALERVSGARASLGAQQNRLEATASALSTAAINQAAAGSLISNTDFAEETSSLLTTSLQQSFATSVLSQQLVNAGAVLRLLGLPG